MSAKKDRTARRMTISRIAVSTCAALALLTVLPLVTACSHEADTYKVGIVQFVAHPALDSNLQGFIDQMTEEGFVQGENVTYDIGLADGDVPLAANMARELVSGKVDLIMAIATPAAQACAAATRDADISVVFGSVTDPVAAGLAASWDRPGGNVTGVSDWTDVAVQVQLILDMVPGVGKLGTIYNPAETNSVVQVEALRSAARGLGMDEVVEATVASSGEVAAAAQSLVDRVDVIWIPTDNTVVPVFETLAELCAGNQISLFQPDVATVERGAIGTLGIDYYELGRECGTLAARILKGDQPAEIPVVKMEMTELYLNPEAAEQMGITIPASILTRATHIVGE